MPERVEAGRFFYKYVQFFIDSQFVKDNPDCTKIQELCGDMIEDEMGLMQSREEDLIKFSDSLDSQSLQNGTHRVWADTMRDLAAAIPDTHGLMIHNVWLKLPLTKARTEKALLELSLTALYSSLRIFNVRPGYVDPPEYHSRPGLGRKIVYHGLAPVLRKIAPGQVTPTGLLSRVCLDLAVGDGRPLDGDDVLTGGRTLLPAAIRRLGNQSPSA
ncbi:hypothetical protein B0H11DRAFT_2293623 [Mycena galericulata]|nr:hypothetical protein B0H11DRAFT_2293623 [Mycena galericulata]